MNTCVMAPLGDVVHRGVVTKPQTDHPSGEGMICVKFTLPVKTMKLYDSIDCITCPEMEMLLTHILSAPETPHGGDNHGCPAL
jgi:hypothetical protein